MRLIYNLGFLDAPLTGIGYCAWHLVSTILERYPNIEVMGIRSGRLLEREALSAMLNDLNNENNFTSGQGSSYSWSVAKRLLNSTFVQSKLFKQAGWLKKRRKQLLAYKAGKAVLGLPTDYIYHELNFALPDYQGPKVTMMHDVSIFACPEYHPKDRVEFMQKQVKASSEQVDAFVVSTEHTKQSLIDLFPCTQGKVHIIPPAAGDDFCVRSQQEVSATLAKYSIGYKKFILCVATLEPRKNMVRLVKAYAQLPKELREEYPLVLAGAKGWLYKKLLEEVRSKKIVDKIILTGYLSRAELCDLFSSAKLVAYPSLYEGFGLPVLEAMCSGTPILTSNITSMPEVCGDAGVLVDPYQIDDISQGLYSVLSDQGLCDKLTAAGLVRAKDFSWEKFARRHVERVYRSLV